MKYISIDIETTGLDPEKHDIIEFGAILEDTKLQLPFETIPKFNTLLVTKTGNFTGNPYALSMHSELFKELAKKIDKRTMNVMSIDSLRKNFTDWIIEKVYNNTTLIISKISIAGKNFSGFDLQFLNKKLPQFSSYLNFSHRTIDPAILYFNPETDTELPDLKTCKQRAGITDSEVSHRTLRDAMDVIEVLRGKMYPKIN